MESGDRRGTPPTTDPAPTCRARADRFDREAAARLGTLRLYGRLRLGLFAATIAGVWLLVDAGRSATAWTLAAAAAVTFAVLVARHHVARRRLERARLMADFNREGIARAARRWADLPAPSAMAPPPDHDYAGDLDLYGHGSLLHLVGECGTAPGRRTLERWLCEPAGPETIAMRRDAVREMAGAYDFRDRLVAEGRMTGGGDAKGIDEFVAWAEDGGWAGGRGWRRVAGYLLPAVNLTAIGLFAAGIAPTPALVWPLLISTAVLMSGRKRINRVFDQADDGESGVRRFGPLLAHLADAPLESLYATAIRRRIGADAVTGSPRNTGTRRRLGAHADPDPPDDRSRSSPGLAVPSDAGPGGTTTRPRPAHREIAALRRLLDLADIRRSPLFHFPLAVVLHWDTHVLAALERWKARSGSRVRDWLDAVGEAEAIAALATLAADHPDWTFPDIDAEAPTLRAEALGHPLLAPDACVRNDVEIGPAGSFLLVTGSNMSGKSTLLKAVGLNAVLAQAGGPACARSLRMPPLRVATSVHVQDSLVDGVSYFMAGLHRLKRVVDAARTPAHPSQSAIDSPTHPHPRTLYLLDEILQGTNSTERRIAARTVLRHLLATGAIGAVTTHDLTLADAEDLVERAVAVHFTESVGEGDEGLTFDYRIRDGIATSTNALRLLEIVGLGNGGAG